MIFRRHSTREKRSNDQSVVMTGQVNANTCTQSVRRERRIFETSKDELERMKERYLLERRHTATKQNNNKNPNTAISFTFDSDTPVTRK